jgi:asparagine synthetase B (glutamine-hydrolysing)
MPGIVAIAADGHDDMVERAELDRFIAAHNDVHGPCAHDVLEAGARGLVAAFRDGAATGVERREGGWKAWVGRAYGAGGALRPEQLDGQFLLIAGDPSGEVRVANDPLGMFPAFVARRAGRTYVATSLLALARHLGASPSVSGIAAYLHTGSQWGRPTVWEGIERLDPATWIVFDEKGRRETRYWSAGVDPQINAMPMSKAVDRCIDVAEDVLARRLRGVPHPWIDLTGGFDSRLLALLLTRIGVSFEGNTVGRDGDADVVIAAKLATMAGWRWRRYELPPDWPAMAPRFAEEALGAGNGHLDALQLGEVLWANGEKASVRTHLLSGGGGETYRSYAWAQEFWRAGRSRSVNMDNWIDMRILSPVDRGLFARDFLPELRADFAQRMRRHAASYVDLPNTTQLEVMYAYKVTGHFGAYAAASSHRLEVELPYYWRDIYESAFSVRAVYRNWNRFQRAMITRLDRRAAALPTERGGPAESWRPWNLHRFAPYFERQFRGVVPKISQRVIGRRLMAEHRSLPERAAAGRRAVLEHFALDPSSMRSGALYDASALRRLLADARDPGFDRWPIVGRIATVEASLRVVDGAHCDV